MVKHFRFSSLEFVSCFVLRFSDFGLTWLDYISSLFSTQFSEVSHYAGGANIVGVCHWLGSKKIRMEKSSKIYVAGHRGLVGSALTRRLKAEGFNNILTHTHAELDLVRQDRVETFFEKEKPDYVFLAAAKVGGIWGNNTYPAEFIYENIIIQSNIIHASYVNKVKKLLFFGKHLHLSKTLSPAHQRGISSL